eukprot:ctg_225.g88
MLSVLVGCTLWLSVATGGFRLERAVERRRTHRAQLGGVAADRWPRGVAVAHLYSAQYYRCATADARHAPLPATVVRRHAVSLDAVSADRERAPARLDALPGGGRLGGGGIVGRGHGRGAHQLHPQSVVCAAAAAAAGAGETRDPGEGRGHRPAAGGCRRSSRGDSGGVCHLARRRRGDRGRE